MTNIKTVIASLEALKESLYDGGPKSNSAAKSGIHNALIRLKGSSPDKNNAIASLREWITPKTSWADKKTIEKAIAIIQSL